MQSNIDELNLQINRSLSQNAHFNAERQEHLMKRQKIRESNALAHRKSSLKSEKTKFYLSMQSPGCFGSDTPRWTIPSSRKPPPPPDPTPAPGKYNIPFCGIETKNRGFTFTRALPLQEDQNTCEVMKTHVFPENNKQIPIANKNKFDHFFMPMPVSPPPTYVPPSLGGPKPVSIGHKYKDDGDKTISPGPGKYTPKDNLRKKSLACSVPRSRGKSFIDEYRNDNPGPGSYDVTPQIRKAPKWTNRARERTRHFQQLYEEHDRPWAVRHQPDETLIRSLKDEM